MPKRYVIEDDAIYFTSTEVNSILRELAAGAVPGLDAQYALRDAAELFLNIEAKSLEDLNAPKTKD